MHNFLSYNITFGMHYKIYKFYKIYISYRFVNLDFENQFAGMSSGSDSA